MDNRIVQDKCRKVYIVLENNRIFDYGNGEYEFISVFRKEESALRTMAHRNDTKTVYPNSEHAASATRKVTGFYLVPASLIEKDTTNRK